MSDLSPGAEPDVVKRAQLMEFMDGFSRECAMEDRIKVAGLELRGAGSDGLIIAVYFSVDGIPRFAAVSYHLPDPMLGYWEYGMQCALQLKASLPEDPLTVLHVN